jgi:hypothetical protein
VVIGSCRICKGYLFRSIAVLGTLLLTNLTFFNISNIRTIQHLSVGHKCKLPKTRGVDIILKKATSQETVGALRSYESRASIQERLG